MISHQAVVSVGVLLSFFYNVVVSWSIWYFFASISSFPLEWSTCNHDYNSVNCYSKFQDEYQCGNGSGDNESALLLFFNNSCVAIDDVCRMSDLTTSVTKCVNGSVEVSPEMLLDRKSTSVEEYWHKHVLGDAQQYNWNNFVSLKQSYIDQSIAGLKTNNYSLKYSRIRLMWSWLMLSAAYCD